MKLKLFLFLFAATLTNLKSQTFYMCSLTNSTSSSTGTIYDSGGPSGNYSSSEDCTFLIKTDCPGNITLNFNSFSTESGYDYLTIRDGSTTTSPVLGSYWGTGSLPPMVATSGYMLLIFHSDYTSNYSGFSASWNFSNANCAPVANFNYSVNACQGKINLLDASTFNPTSWLWNFGDGDATTLQNPVHTYTAAGTYPVTLIATNNYGSTTITKNITVNPIKFKIGFNGAPLMKSAMSFTTDNTTGSVYTWDFGDGTAGGTANVIHTYNSLGTFIVSLTIASGSCVTTSTMQVVLKDGVGFSDVYLPSYMASVHPNPSAGASILSLQLAKTSTIKIEVLNQLGQTIRSVANESMNAGEYKFELNEIPTGVYYIKISEGDQSRSLKMISIK